MRESSGGGQMWATRREIIEEVQVCQDGDPVGGDEREPRGGGAEKKGDPGDPVALEQCIDAATRDYIKEWERSRKVTGLGEGLSKIAEHMLIEKTATYIYPPAGLVAAFGYLLYEEYGNLSDELKADVKMESDLSTRKENCRLAFGPRE